jgi:hypothetical protein
MVTGRSAGNIQLELKASERLFISVAYMTLPCQDWLSQSNGLYQDIGIRANGQHIQKLYDVP